MCPLFSFFINMVGIIALIIFIAGYLLITLEHKLNTNKSAVALSLGAILWILAALTTPDKSVISHIVTEAGAEIFQIVVFLLAAMTLVEILVHYRFFDVIRTKLARMKLNDKKQFAIMGVLTFFLSAVLDNLTITIVMIQIARQFFSGKNLVIVAAGIVILANAGGAWSPIGDVTTIMLWLAHKFTAIQIITEAFIPSAVLALVSGYLMYRQINNTSKDYVVDKPTEFSKSEKFVIGSVLASFSFPLFMNLIGLPPYLGLLLGLGVVWAFIEYFKRGSTRTTHLDASIETMLQKTDISSLKFFIGILLAVSALHVFGILETVSHFIFGEHQELQRVVFGSAAIGLLSAIVDNVPLTALSIDLIKLEDPRIWTFLALAVGTGGSALAIGSVAGVVAMGMVKDLTFGKYLKIATIPALAGYAAGITAFYLMFFAF